MVRKERHTPTPEEARTLIEFLRKPEYTPLREMVILSCSTSVHYAEMTALRWRRVNLPGVATIADGRNLPAKSLSVCEGFYRGSFSSTLKAKARTRTEPIPGLVAEALAALKRNSNFTDPDDLVFCDQATGKPIDEDVLRRKLKKSGKAIGLAWALGFHAFRRYFATEADRKGMSTRDAQAALGHASSEMTQHYTTVDIERRRPVMDRIADDLVESGPRDIRVA